MTKKFEILSHTADARVKVFGKTKEELFRNAMLVMVEILKSPACAKASAGRQISIPPWRDKSQNLLRKKVSIKSPDIDSLLVDFLSEVLYQSQVNKVVYCDAEFSEFSDTEIEAEISGFKVDSFDEDIKAVTYHELEIKKSSPAGGTGGFETIIVFDV